MMTWYTEIARNTYYKDAEPGEYTDASPYIEESHWTSELKCKINLGEPGGRGKRSNGMRAQAGL
jgi:hypothetical protein